MASVGVRPCRFCGEKFDVRKLGNHARWCKKKPVGYVSKNKVYQESKKRKKVPVENGAALAFCPCCGTNLRWVAQALAALEVMK